VLAVSLEFAAKIWKVALYDGRRERPALHTVEHPQAAARLQAVQALIDQHKDRCSRPADVRVVVCYEAGQDAFWIWRGLQAHGIECYVVDPASIPVERRIRRAKTDRLDAIKLATNLRAWLRGECDRMHVVHVPSAQDEASGHLMRERGQLQKEVLQQGGSCLIDDQQLTACALLPGSGLSLSQLRLPYAGGALLRPFARQT
jgi:transposase